uniref:Pleckstrin homology and RhoGEF domain containing G4B n=1 Tax=Ornithorhynchus anatinus TaxID=9258 RepID=F7E158_ORNAN
MNHKAPAPKPRGDSCLRIKDSESLDTYIQNTLSELYPPFKATAPTVLWQLFSIVEKLYQGDGLRCLIDFLVPAKRILQCIQQETCAKYTGLIFHHEGWPLCTHEKVVVQLASLHKVRLEPGDFYLQVVSVGHQSAKLVIKHLSPNGKELEEVTVPDTMYGCLFTIEFLESVNYNRHQVPLQNCLLTCGPAVYRTRWKNITNPIFVPTPESILPHSSSSSPPDLPSDPSPEDKIENNCSHAWRNPVSGLSSSVHSLGGRAEMESPETLREDSGGDHRGLNVFSPERPIIERTWPETTKMGVEIDGLLNGEEVSDKEEEKTNSMKNITFSPDLSRPGTEQQQLRDPPYFETKRLFRKSYMEALQNPMHLGSSSEESISDEPSARMGHCLAKHTENMLVNKAAEKATREENDLPKRLVLEEEPEVVRSPKNVSQPLEKSQIPGSFLIVGNRAIPRRRSRSLDRSPKNSQDRDRKPLGGAEDSSNVNPQSLLNGHAFKPEKWDSSSHLFVPVKSHTCPEEDEDVSQNTDVVGPDNCLPGDDTTVFASTTPMLRQAENESLPTNAGDFFHRPPNGLLAINREFLQSSVIAIPGSRDRNGRAIVQVCTRSAFWLSEHPTSANITQLLMYFYSIPRKEIQDLGLVILVDARKCQPIPALFQAFTTLQNTVPHSVHSVLLLVDKESSFRPEKDTVIQYEVLMSLKALHKLIDSAQLTADLDGTFPYNHSDWIRFRQKVEPFSRNCKEAILFLQNSVCSLNSNRTLSSVQEVKDLINQHKTMMKLVLEDDLLVTLRLEGGTVLARIRKEEFCTSEDHRDAIEAITRLYNQVDEEVHRLVLLSNKSLQQLENLQELRKLEEGCDQIKLWFENEREKYFGPLDKELLSVAKVKKKQEEFRVFGDMVMQYCKQGLHLLKDNRAPISEEKIQNFKRYLKSILTQTERRKGKLEDLASLYEFYETANAWLLHCNEFLEHLTLETKYSPSDLQCLKSYHQEATKVSAENFQKVNDMVLGLGSQKEQQQWILLWLQCQQARHRLEEALSAAARLKSHEARAAQEGEIEQELAWEEKKQQPYSFPFPQLCTGGNLAERNGLSLSPSTSCPRRPVLSDLEDVTQDECGWIPPAPVPFPSVSPVSGLPRTGHILDDADDVSTISSLPEPSEALTALHRKHPLKKMMKKAQGFELPQLESSPRVLQRHKSTGVSIKGLEVMSCVAPEKKPSLQRPNVQSPLVGRNRSLSSPSRIHHMEEEERKRTGSNKVQHIMDEMITTEREYVRALGYIIDNYFPEMERMDLPQDLRGKRNVIFGNLEKLHDFHSHYFLKELEHCRNCPLPVSHCFLRHEEQFGMYALYSKNKPQSDALLTSHGNIFFKNKQQDLGDKMDLASYLLKPIQRMSKYALLLKDLIQECAKTQAQELSDLRAAEEMVKFQLRHGNDLLAMDAIRGCDVNLKEQGQLRCQDEFIVSCGRKKYLRHVFLFEDLILFSKTKKIDGGYDVYMYKQSFKTAEIGMTESVGDSGLRFEIWFRRRRKSQDTFILQARSAEVKVSWTNIIGKILWRQALRNRELRMREMVSMGIGNKPFLDIEPSDAAISDRAIDYIMKGTESRSRASIAVSSFDHSTPFKRPHSTISNSSTSSSSGQSTSSILGSLNLHTYSSPAYPGLPNPPSYQWSWDIQTCIEEDELEQETGSQPSMITEGSESSHCTSGDSVSGVGSWTQPAWSPHPSETLSDDGTLNPGTNPPSQCASPAFPERNPQPKLTSSPHVTTMLKERTTTSEEFLK